MAGRFRKVGWNEHTENSPKSVLTWNRTQPGKLVFPSMCDWLQPEVPPEMLARFMGTLQATPNLIWLLLSKRPESFQERMDRAYNHIKDQFTARMVKEWVDINPPANVWVGTSVEDQQRADERIPALLRIPAAHRFLSVEPLLGQVDLLYAAFNGTDSLQSLPGLDWVIVGGESGPGARPCNIAWIRDIRDQCAGSDVPCLVKQFGSNPIMEPGPITVQCEHPKGGDPAEWPEDLRVQQWPQAFLK